MLWFVTQTVNAVVTLEFTSSCGTAAIKMARVTTADEKGEGDNCGLTATIICTLPVA